MKPETLHVGMRVRHPQYGVGVVKAVTEHTADILFDDGRRTLAPENSGLSPAEAMAALTQLDVPLPQLVRSVVEAALRGQGIESPAASAPQLGARWHRGKLVLHPADPTLQTKEIPLEVFFHKIVMMRNQLRVLEQKINASEKMSDAEKVELQQYLTRCYGSMTTFNVLFEEKADAF